MLLRKARDGRRALPKICFCIKRRRPPAFTYTGNGQLPPHSRVSQEWTGAMLQQQAYDGRRACHGSLVQGATMAGWTVGAAIYGKIWTPLGVVVVHVRSVVEQLHEAWQYEGAQVCLLCSGAAASSGQHAGAQMYHGT